MSHSVAHESPARPRPRTRAEPDRPRPHPLLTFGGAVGNHAFQRALRRKPGAGKGAPCACGGECDECQGHESDTELEHGPRPVA